MPEILLLEVHSGANFKRQWRTVCALLQAQGSQHMEQIRPQQHMEESRPQYAVRKRVEDTGD